MCVDVFFATKTRLRETLRRAGTKALSLFMLSHKRPVAQISLALFLFRVLTEMHF